MSTSPLRCAIMTTAGVRDSHLWEGCRMVVKLIGHAARFALIPLHLAFISTAAWGVTFSEHGWTLLSDYNATTRSVSLGDIDNDGDLDVFFQGQALNATRLY